MLSFIRTLALSACLILPGLARGGDFANNGGGSAEHNFIYAYHLLIHFIENCLQQALCEVSSDDRRVLQAIQTALPREGAAHQLLAFRLPSEEGFILDGAMRVAKTGDRVASPIVINRQMIYELKDGKPAAMDVPRAAAVLIHELGHHHGIADHSYLDLLGTKLRAFLMRSVMTQYFDPRLFMSDQATANFPYIPSFTVIYLNPGDRWQPNTRLIVNDSVSAYDLTSLVAASLAEASLCSGGTVVGFDLLSPRWEQSYFYKPFGSAPYFNLVMNGVLNVVCRDSAGRVSSPNGLIYNLNLGFERVNGQLVYRRTDRLIAKILQQNPFGR